MGKKWNHCSPFTKKWECCLSLRTRIFKGCRILASLVRRFDLHSLSRILSLRLRLGFRLLLFRGWSRMILLISLILFLLVSLKLKIHLNGFTIWRELTSLNLLEMNILKFMLKIRNLFRFYSCKNNQKLVNLYLSTHKKNPFSIQLVNNHQLMKTELLYSQVKLTV